MYLIVTVEIRLIICAHIFQVAKTKENKKKNFDGRPEEMLIN